MSLVVRDCPDPVTSLSDGSETSGIKESMGQSLCQVGSIAQRCFENHGAECVAANSLLGSFAGQGKKKERKMRGIQNYIHGMSINRVRVS